MSTSGRHRLLKKVGLFAAIVAGCMLAAIGPGARSVSAQGTVPPPPWLEPRGINIVDFVGLVPESHLADAIISYETGTGVVQYVSGKRNGSNVEITVRFAPRYGATFTKVGCLGQWAAYDQWPSAAPASTLRVFSGGQEITGSVVQVNFVPAGLVQPVRGSEGYVRYDKQLGPAWGAGVPAQVPANMGCEILIQGVHNDLTGIFTLNTPQRISVEVLASRSWTAHSYIGPGARGDSQYGLKGLADQMGDLYADRHDRWALNTPAGADFLLFKYPPTSYDPYLDQYSAGQAGSGTYRLEPPSGGLSVDHVNTMGITLDGQWKNAGKNDTAEFLPYNRPIVVLAGPEYFLPPGVPYDPCMSPGTCSTSVLERVYNATYPVTAYFYRVEPLDRRSLLRIPLRLAGNGYHTSAAAETGADALVAAATLAEGAAPLQNGAITWLPIVSNGSEPDDGDDRSGCPCGYFDGQGRMFGFIPPP